MKAKVPKGNRAVAKAPVRVGRVLEQKAPRQSDKEVADNRLVHPSATNLVELYTPARIREFDDAEGELARFFDKS
ncbi:MAG: hypothetical protein JSS28_05170 [Proteobacteria bacterium]|nr:hypothetical protein [Pseudomonadota bacterium]